MKLGQVISLNNDSLTEIKNDKEYTIAGVQSYGKGIINRRKVIGTELKMKKYKIIKENQLMWCKVDTKNGAFGITKKEHVGSLASTNMALADIDTEKADPSFLELLFRNKFFYEWINSKSTGTTNRKYLKPKDVCEKIEIPNLLLKDQKDFVKKYNYLEDCGIIKNIEKDISMAQKLRHSILQEAVIGNWESLPIVKCFRTISNRGNQLKATEYLESGKFPVVDQGKNLIPGYSNDGSKLLKLKNPLIVFGDHTKQVKYIDFDFVVGADGTKILEPVEGILPKFFYYVLKGFNLENKGYARHFKILKQEEFPLPSLGEQKRIVKKVDLLMNMCDDLEIKIKENKKDSEKLMSAVLKEVFEN